jgi:hypothetical protein
MHSLQTLNTEAQQAEEVSGDGPSDSRFTFGIYFYAEQTPDSKED